MFNLWKLLELAFTAAKNMTGKLTKHNTNVILNITEGWKPAYYYLARSFDEQQPTQHLACSYGVTTTDEDTTDIPVPHAKHVNAMTLPCEMSWSNQDAVCQHCTVCYQSTSHHRGWESNSTQPTCITKRQKSCMIVPSKVRMMQGLFTLAKVSGLSSGAGLLPLHLTLQGQMRVTLRSAPEQGWAQLTFCQVRHLLFGRMEHKALVWKHSRQVTHSGAVTTSSFWFTLVLIADVNAMARSHPGPSRAESGPSSGLWWKWPQFPQPSPQHPQAHVGREKEQHHVSSKSSSLSASSAESSMLKDFRLELRVLGSDWLPRLNLQQSNGTAWK